MRQVLSIAIGLGVVGSLAEGGVQVFFADFDHGAVPEISGYVRIESVQGFAGAGQAGNRFEGLMLRNNATGNPASATLLSLSNLPSHDFISVGFLLAYIDSWDGAGGPPYGPDYFNISIDGIPILQISSGHGTPIFSGPAGWRDWDERAIDLSSDPLLASIPHSASTLVIRFFSSGAGWQGGEDESWGIDNLRVSVGIVPAPWTPLALLMLSTYAIRRRPE